MNIILHVYHNLKFNLRNSLLLLSCVIALQSYSKPLPGTFRNYRLSLGAGLGYSPLILLAPKPFNYMPWEKCKPMLKFELTTGTKHSINFGYQNERYDFDIYPTFTHITTNSDYQIIDNVKSNVNAKMHSLTFDYRIYSTLIGGIAPYGRYIFYGFSVNTTIFNVPDIRFSVPDPDNSSLEYYTPAHQFKTNTTGFRIGLGKKKYIGKQLKSFLEYQFLCDMKIGDFKTGLDFNNLPRYGGINTVTYQTAMRISQMTSVFQFTIHYGFSL